MEYIVNSEEEWHVLRRQYITASEAAALVGLNPYLTPSKIRNKGDFGGNANTILGQVLEPVVVEIANRVLNENFVLFEEVKGEKHFFTKGFFGATPDSWNQKQLLECKSAKPDIYERYIEEIPEHYLVQLMVQLFCTGLTEGYLAIISTNLTQEGGTVKWPIVIYRVLMCEEFCDILTSEADRFINSESFRVNSVIKKECKELLKYVYERVYYNESTSKQNLKELMRMMQQ